MDDASIISALAGASGATPTSVPFEKGLRIVRLGGTRPLRPGQPRPVGRALTLRFVPAREDLATPRSRSSPKPTRAAIGAVPAGSIAVAHDDGAVVVPAALMGEAAAAGQERLERWIHVQGRERGRAAGPLPLQRREQGPPGGRKRLARIIAGRPCRAVKQA